MARTKLKIQTDFWDKYKGDEPRVCALKVLIATLTYLDVAIRQRHQTAATVTIAADLREELKWANLKKANEAYSLVALRLRVMGIQVSKIERTEAVGLRPTLVDIIEARLGFEGIKVTNVRRKLRHAKKELEKLVPPNPKKVIVDNK